MVIAEAARIAQPGDRLFVGPANLRKTPYSDAYLYYMLPRARPRRPTTSRWTRAWPTPRTPLAEDLAVGRPRHPLDDLGRLERAQRLPEDGSDEAERVLERDFCLVGNYLRPLRALPTVQLTNTRTR